MDKGILEPLLYVAVGFLLIFVPYNAYLTNQKVNKLLDTKTEQAYKNGYAEGLEKADVVTVYLCRDWIPTVGYKAWRQCNMEYVAETERQQQLSEE